MHTFAIEKTIGMSHEQEMLVNGMVMYVWSKGVVKAYSLPDAKVLFTVGVVATHKNHDLYVSDDNELLVIPLLYFPLIIVYSTSLKKTVLRIDGLRKCDELPMAFCGPRKLCVALEHQLRIYDLNTGIYTLYPHKIGVRHADPFVACVGMAYNKFTQKLVVVSSRGDIECNGQFITNILHDHSTHLYIPPREVFLLGPTVIVVKKNLYSLDFRADGKVSVQFNGECVAYGDNYTVGVYSGVSSSIATCGGDCAVVSIKPYKNFQGFVTSDGRYLVYNHLSYAHILKCSTVLPRALYCSARLHPLRGEGALVFTQHYQINSDGTVTYEPIPEKAQAKLEGSSFFEDADRHGTWLKAVEVHSQRPFDGPLDMWKRHAFFQLRVARIYTGPFNLKLSNDIVSLIGEYMAQ